MPQMAGEGDGEVVRLAVPDTEIEEHQIYRKLVECILISLDRLDVDERTRSYLAVLWQFVRAQASEGIETEAVSRLDRALWVEPELLDEERPSLRKLAEQLRIPRDRLPALYRTLGSLLERCRAAISGKTAVSSLKGKSTQERRN